LNSNKTLIRYG